MSNRLDIILNHLSSQMSQKKYLKEPLSFLQLEDLIPADLNEKRKILRDFLNKEVVPTLAEFYEKPEFPLFLLPKLKDLFGIPSGLYGCQQVLAKENFLNLYEIGRADGALAAFYATNSLIIHALDILASEEQKREFLPKVCKLETLFCWALAELDTGSHYNTLKTNVDSTPDGYIINGTKKWPVNSAVAHYFIVWARPSGKTELEAFIVPTDSKGVSISRGKSKFNNRIIQNGSIKFENVVIPKKYRLEKSGNPELFAKVLNYSRLIVAMAPIGIISGVFEKIIQYTSETFQNGESLMRFQLIQEKLFRMLGHFCNAFLINWRAVQMIESEDINFAQVSMVKAMVTSAGRDVVRLGREMMPGNGASIENYVMKALVDMESYFTLEGTYDICVLVTGKHLTGISAFKSSYKQKVN